MEFKSQICTTIEQSKRLLELGLKKETADMVYQAIGVTPFNKWKEHKIQEDFFPAWSLHRLLSIMPTTFKYYNEEYGEECEMWLYVDMPKSVRYEDFMVIWEDFNKTKNFMIISSIV